ncbi:MAG: YraN family protein [Chloroflexi bacterium]|nr:YraN family protein [Chloroflexota bacterium]
MGKIKRHHLSLGTWGEEYAAYYLEQKGYTILSRNIRTPFGEIDLLARQNPEGNLVFVEVKTRATKKYGPPEISVTRRKQEHLIASISSYFQEHPEIEESWRVDIIAVEKPDSRETPTITHFENVIQV